jgi:hypothetical protein
MDEATREQARELREQMREQVADILAPEQLAQLEQLRGERRAERQEQRQAEFPERLERHVGFLTRMLKLDEAQQQQIGDILVENHEQIQTLHQNAREQDLSFEDLREQLEQIREQTSAAISKLLTAEQATIFDAIQSLLPPHRGLGRGFRGGR